jgi:hypothetical protein
VNVKAGVPSQLSVADGEPVLAGKVLAVQSIVMLAGQLITGPALSSTKMVCVQLLELPQSSVARHVRVIVLSCGTGTRCYLVSESDRRGNITICSRC